MLSLHHLRECRALVRWMLVCFCLSLGVAMAAPVFSPPGSVLVCTALGSVKLVSPGDAGDSGPDAAPHVLHCVLCLSAGAPPAAAPVAVLAPDLRQVYRARHGAVLHWRDVPQAAARDPPLST